MKQLMLLAFLLIFGSVGNASELDSKSLFVGVGLGLGTYASRQYIAKPVVKATVKAAKKTAKGTLHAVTLGRK